MKPASPRSLLAVLLLFVSMTVTGGLTACSTQNASSDPAGVVKKYLEAQKNNDYDAWVATLIVEKQRAFTKASQGNFGVISLTVNKVAVSNEETQRMKDRYIGSDLARGRGWSDEYLAANMIVVSARYTVDYDNTKVPYQEGALNQNFILIRDNQNAPWLIWDTTSPSL